MIGAFLKNVRKQRCIGAAQALSKIGGQGWSDSNGNIQKEFVFRDFKEASFFISRYSDYCQKLGSSPSWQNVYNKVNVTLSNAEFGQISSKEVELAQYLDMLHSVKVSDHSTINEHHSFEHILNAGQIGVLSNVNAQENKTTLYLANLHSQARLA